MSTKLFVKYKSYCLNSFQSEKDYGDWGSTNDFSVEGVTLTKPEDYNFEEFEVPDSVKKGDDVYVLWMSYSTGDSFGSSTGNGEIIWVFSDKKLGEKAKALWNNSKEYYVEFDVGHGITKKIHNPAYGYFEDIEYLSLETFTVSK